jgi:hypothetical protein
MIREGYGHEYTYDVPYKYQKQFKKAEAYARDHQLGLWAPDACKDFQSEAPAEKTTPAPSSREEIPTTTAYTCASDTYNCSDFQTQAEARAVLQYCLTQTGRDVHRLDSDHDGVPCESLPN